MIDLKDEFYRRSKGIVIAIEPPKTDIQMELDELVFLAKTLKVDVIKCFTQRLLKPHPKYYVGKGKLEQIAIFMKAESIEVVVFDGDVKPSQLRHISALLKTSTILDKTSLILQIFMQRAKTRQAKMQVELAQYEYLLPRLTHYWTHHSKQRGGIGLKGPGETELETDKRIVRHKISVLKKRLKKIESQTATQQQTRTAIPKMVLVGYTNVGKSSLMNAMTQANVLVKNQLFATLDSTVRRVSTPSQQFLLADTVGFIHKIPTVLIESFHSTLSEVTQADVILHVIDMCAPDIDQRISVVNHILKQLKAKEILTYIICNKLDLFLEQNKHFGIDEQSMIETFQKRYFPEEKRIFFISSTQKKNTDILKEYLLNLSTHFYTV